MTSPPFGTAAPATVRQATAPSITRTGLEATPAIRARCQVASTTWPWLATTWSKTASTRSIRSATCTDRRRLRRRSAVVSGAGDLDQRVHARRQDAAAAAHVEAVGLAVAGARVALLEAVDHVHAL